MLTILIVDPDARDRARTRRELLHACPDASVREITTLPELSSAAVDTGGVDVVVTEFSPWVDNGETLSRLRARHADVPVIVFSDLGDAERVVDAMKLGAADYVLKTADAARLASALRGALARRREASALRESEERFRLLVEAVRDYAIFMVDLGGHVASWNPGAERICGYAADEIIGGALATFYTADDRESNVPARELAEARERGRASDTRWLVRRDGSRFWAEGVTTAIRDETGGVRMFAKVVRDATPRKRADEERAELIARERRLRAQAESANRMKDDFLATVSHELRTPLNAIFGWTRLLRTRTLDAATIARALETIERNAEAQRQLVEDLLDVSRIITGRLRLDIRPTDLVDAIDAAIDTVLPAARARNITLEKEAQPGVGVVGGDVTRLQQVVWNLLSNAVKFTPPGGRVVVRLEMRDGEVTMEVRDTGPGVPEEFLDRIFERFTQAETAATRSCKGLGLGLAIVRHLVELHGGIVDVENSPAPGWGAVFTVRLPAAVAPSTPLTLDETRGGDRRAESVARPAEPMLAGVRVLVVEDDHDSRDLITSVLATSGADVAAVPSVDEALARLDRGRFDVVISDIAIPDRDGYELIRELRSRPADRGGETPAIALTARARVGDRTPALTSGFQLHVPKPVEPAELCVVVASLSARARAA